jgi:hypothetical protein
MTARTIGTIIIVVAVFEIHMERKAVAAMKPRRIARGRTPKRTSTRRAMRRCRSQRCMARATRNPPMNRKMTWLKYSFDTALPSSTPKAGRSTTGTRLVTASGMASVIHQTAMRIATAAVRVTSGRPGSKSAKSSTPRASAGPSQRPVRRSAGLAGGW